MNIYFIIIYLTIVIFTAIVLHQRKEKNKILKYQIDLKYGFNPNIEDCLNTIIENVFNEYRLYNLEYKDNDYIKSVDEQKIIKDVCTLVSDRLSPTFITQLSTYFNFDSIGSIIASKVSTKVMEYRISRNVIDNKIEQ